MHSYRISPFFPIAGALLWCVVLALALAACRTPAPMPPADLTQPGWNIHRGQAVWLSSRQGAELAGELLFATNNNGDTLIEFVKTPLPVIVVRLSPETWQLEFATANRHHIGRNPPPARSAWLVLPRCLAGHAPPPGWSYEIDRNDNWVLDNQQTGERLRGYLLP